MTLGPRPPELLETLTRLLRSFPPEPAPYCLIGALAVGIWGRPRATLDIDLLMMLDVSAEPAFVAQLERAGFLLDRQWADRNPMMKGVGMRFRSGSLPVDILLPRDDHERHAMGRRVTVTVEGLSMWTAGPEDLILLKLKACRDHDLVDAQSIVHRQGAHLDREYLWRWADRLGLHSELTYVLNISGGSEA